MRRLVLACLAVGLMGAAAFAEPSDLDVYTEFSFNTGTGVPFTVGTSPASAEFSGNAFSGVASIGELYRSGFQAWMVNPNGTGFIQFETNATIVAFYTRIRTGANGSSVYTAYDDLDQVIDTVTINTPGAFQLLSFTGSIDRIEIVNNASGTTDMNSIEDFGFSIPEPASAGALLLGLAITAWRRRAGSFA